MQQLENAAPNRWDAGAEADADDPSIWLGSTVLLDLEDTRLRLRVRALTQLCKSEREVVVTLYGFVKRLLFCKPFKMRLYTAREVLDHGRGDQVDKATLLVAMLRLAGIPARMRFVTLHPETMRGLPSAPEPTRPVVEIYRNWQWTGTDTFIYDAAYVDAARRRLARVGWKWGYGIRLDGQFLWNGTDGAYLGGLPTAMDAMVLYDHGTYCDPLEFISSASYRAKHKRLPRMMHRNLTSPIVELTIRDLRLEGTAS